MGVEGYPADTGPDRVDVISGYVGTVRLFEAAGFERAAETGGVSGGRRRWLMRRELARDEIPPAAPSQPG